jgi:hypothetical protein
MILCSASSYMCGLQAVITVLLSPKLASSSELLTLHLLGRLGPELSPHHWNINGNLPLEAFVVIIERDHWQYQVQYSPSGGINKLSTCFLIILLPLLPYLKSEQFPWIYFALFIIKKPWNCFQDENLSNNSLSVILKPKENFPHKSPNLIKHERRKKHFCIQWNLKLW